MTGAFTHSLRGCSDLLSWFGTQPKFLCKPQVLLFFFAETPHRFAFLLFFPPCKWSVSFACRFFSRTTLGNAPTVWTSPLHFLPIPQIPHLFCPPLDNFTLLRSRTEIHRLSPLLQLPGRSHAYEFSPWFSGPISLFQAELDEGALTLNACEPRAR